MDHFKHRVLCAVCAEFIMIHISEPDFWIGTPHATPAVLESLEEADVDIIVLVERHNVHRLTP